jgi:hypothetical protein
VCRNLGEELGNGCNRLGSSRFLEFDRKWANKLNRDEEMGKRSRQKKLQRSRTLDWGPDKKSGNEVVLKSGVLAKRCVNCA